MEQGPRLGAPLVSRGARSIEGEEHGLSVFFCLDDAIFNTYSTYARGAESLTEPIDSSTPHPTAASKPSKRVAAPLTP
jgi:hypothetical protein